MPWPEPGSHLLASGGTHAALAEAGLEVTEVAAYTGQPEILGGRVKTLHPKLHGGILARREVAEDLAALEAQGIEPIDLVVVNLYPFEATIAQPGVTFEEAIENIDIGGPSLIRGAAKNHAHVAVVVDPDQYPALIEQLRDLGGTTLDDAARPGRGGVRADRPLRPGDRRLPRRRARPRGRSDRRSPPSSAPGSSVGQCSGTARTRTSARPSTSSPATVGPEPGDRDDRSTARSSRTTTCSTSTAPCAWSGTSPSPPRRSSSTTTPAARRSPTTLAEAFELAYEGDPVSAFGGIVGLNRPVDRATAERLVVPGRFIEAIIAPGFDPDALALLTTKPTWKNSVRLLDLKAPIGPTAPAPAGFDLRRVEGGLLVQDWDTMEADPASGEVATRREPTPEERSALGFAWRVCPGGPVRTRSCWREAGSSSASAPAR